VGAGNCYDMIRYGKRLYKFRLREQAISRARLETEARRKPEAFITEEQVRAIQAKESGKAKLAVSLGFIFA
jgi:hypothetical protein